MRKIIKNIVSITFCILLCASTVQGEDAEQARERLMVQTRNMINAGVPDDEAEKMVRVMSQNNFRHQHMIRALKVVVDTGEEGLPVAPVMNKAYEGIAKNAPDEIIVKAMEKTRQQYAYAYGQAKQVTDDKQQIQRIGKAIVDGLKAGLNKDGADQIMAAVRQQTRQMNRRQAGELAEESFLAARTMARFGVSSTSATDITCQALQNNYSAENIRQLQNRFQAQAMNTPPAIVAEQYIYSIHNGIMAEQLRSNYNGGDSVARNKGNRGQGGSSTGNSMGPGTSGGPRSGGSGPGGSGSGGSGSGGSGSGGSKSGG